MKRSGKSYCPLCLRQLDGRLVVDRHVWLVRRCPEHGYFKTLVFHSPAYLAKALTARSTRPNRCLVVEVTERCDVGCATCSASSTISGSEQSGERLTKKTLEVARGIGANIVALSGGEPLMRSDLWQIADAIHVEIPKVVLITSGRNFETDPRILSEIAVRSEWLEVYLQFDSLQNEVLKAIRTPLVTAELRRQRLRLAVATGAPTSAVCVVPPETPEETIGQLAVFCRDEGAAGVSFQPLRRLGRYPAMAPVSSPLTTIDYIQKLALGALGVTAPPKPFPQQPFDISVAFVRAGKVVYPDEFFREKHQTRTFRVASSSYWDFTNYFEPFAETGQFYFYAGSGVPLNTRYFRGSHPARNSASSTGAAPQSRTHAKK